jgi:hypothetical protein
VDLTDMDAARKDFIREQEELTIPHVLDDPPPFHTKVTDWGERPYWYPDGRKIAFIGRNYGDAYEYDLDTQEIVNITEHGDHHAFLRVLVMHNGDYLLVGPKEFKDRITSRYFESEVWWMPADRHLPPQPLDDTIIQDGLAVSWTQPLVSYMQGYHQDKTLPEFTYRIHVRTIEYDADGIAHWGPDRVVYDGGKYRWCEPQDFRFDDTEIIFAEYQGPERGDRAEYNSVTRGVNIETGRVRTYVDETNRHNEPEGIFPDNMHTCLESSCDAGKPYPPKDLWKLKLDGTMRRVRMTRMPDDHSWRAVNSNISPDGRTMAFMVGLQSDEAGYGRGIGLFDLEAWERTPEAQEWETPASRAELSDRVLPRGCAF